jgi:23S rRNA pseudouridine1911/1915/1917 synthase
MAVQAQSGATRSWSVPAIADKSRLDAFARRCLPHLSRLSLAAAVAEKFFRVNGRIAKKGDKLKAGDHLTFHGPEFWLAAGPAPQSDLHVQTVHEDESMLVLNKPAGMATHGFSGRDRNTLANFLAARHPGILTVGNSRWEAGLVHRLDRDTSGLVIVAKTQAAFERLRAQFRRRQIKKKYAALVWGVTAGAGSIAYRLAHDAGDSKRMRALVEAPAGPVPKSWSAFTQFRKVSAAPGLSLLEIEMTTGVTHQIRVHLAAIGHPIVGDAIYGPGAGNPLGLKRHFLHAARLDFYHPDHGASVTVEAKLPRELREVLKNLGMESA